MKLTLEGSNKVDAGDPDATPVLTKDISSVTPAENVWTYETQNVPSTDLVNYKVELTNNGTSLKGYTVNTGDNAGEFNALLSTYTITPNVEFVMNGWNAYPESITITVTSDKDDSESIMTKWEGVHSSKAVQTLKINNDGTINWTDYAGWSHLPTHAKGEQITYTVTISEVGGFTIEPPTKAFNFNSDTTDWTAKFKLTYDVPNTTDNNYSVKVTFDDEQNKWGLRPETIDLSLDDGATSVTVPAYDEINHVFYGLGADNYALNDIDAAGYTQEDDPNTYEDEKPKDVSKDVILKLNTQKIQPKITWEDDSEYVSLRPATDSLTMTITGKKTADNTAFDLTPGDDSGTELKLASWTDNTDDTWSGATEELPTTDLVTYTSKLSAPAGYNLTETTTAGDSPEFKLTLKTESVSPKITWVDSGWEALRPSIEAITLKITGSKDEQTIVNQTIGGSDWSDNGDYTWTIDAYQLPSSEIVKYTSELTVPKGYTLTDEGNYKYKLTLKTVELNPTLIWEDDSNKYSTRPYVSDLKLINLTDDGSTELTLGTEGTDPNIQDVNTWIYSTTLPTITEGGAVAEYTLAAPEVTGYTAQVVSDTKLTYKMILNRSTLEPTIIWDDQGNKYGLRPTSMEVTISGVDGYSENVDLTPYVDGETITLTAQDKASNCGCSAVSSSEIWKTSIDGLPTDELFTYSTEIKPEEVYGYTLDDSNAPIYKYTLNILGEESALTPTVTWIDEDNKTKMRPAYVRLEIAGKTEEGMRVNLNGQSENPNHTILVTDDEDGDNTWEQSITNLPDLDYYLANWSEPAGYTVTGLNLTGLSITYTLNSLAGGSATTVYVGNWNFEPNYLNNLDKPTSAKAINTGNGNEFTYDEDAPLYSVAPGNTFDLKLKDTNEWWYEIEHDDTAKTFDINAYGYAFANKYDRTVFKGNNSLFREHVKAGETKYRNVEEAEDDASNDYTKNKQPAELIMLKSMDLSKTQIDAPLFINTGTWTLAGATIVAPKGTTVLVNDGGTAIMDDWNAITVCKSQTGGTIVTKKWH